MIGIFLNMGIAKGLVNTIKNHMNAIIDSLDSEVVAIDINAGNKLKNLLDRDDIEYRHISWIENSNWQEYEKLIKSQTKDLNTLIIFGNTMFNNYNSRDTSLIERFDKEFDNKNYEYNIKFVSTRTVMQRYLVCRTCKDKKLIYVCLDPQECIITDYLKTGICTYILNRGNKKYVPSYEKCLFTNNQTADKTVDFTFYGTALTEDRKYLVEQSDLLTGIRNSDVGIIVKKDSTYVSQTEYYDKLARSKFTLIIPSYDVTTFSVIRFLEAVSNHCLPLVLDTVDLTDLKNTFPDIYDIVRKNLVVNIKDIQGKIDELDYDKIIKKIFNTESVKNFTDLDYFKREWSKIV
jgi:hypothetical protein